LQRTQVFGVGRGDVDGDVACVRVGFFEAGEVVGGGVFDGGYGVFADVDTEYAFVASFLT